MTFRHKGLSAIRVALAASCLATGSSCSRSADTWTVPTPRPFLAGDSSAFTPQIDDQGVAFICGGYPYTAQSVLLALRAATGDVLWQFPLETCADSPAIIGPTVIAFAHPAHTSQVVLIGVDAATGQEKWRREIGDAPFHAKFGDFIYLSLLNGDIRRLDGRTGNVDTLSLSPRAAGHWWLTASADRLLVGSGVSLWTSANPSTEPVEVVPLETAAAHVTAAVASGSLLLLEDRDNRLSAFDIDTGRLRWTQAFHRLLSAPSIHDGRAFINTFGPNRYELQSLDAASGRPLWNVLDASFSAPSASHGRVYAAGRQSVLVLDEETGKVLAELASSSEVISTPILFGDLLLFGTIDGTLHAGRISAGNR